MIREKKFFKLFLVVIMALILLVTVGCGEDKVDENAANIKIISVDYKQDKTEIELPQVSNMKNESLQKKINDNIKEAILAYENKGSDGGLIGGYSIAFLNDRLLIIVFNGWNFIPDSNGIDGIKAGIHVDLTNGKIYTLSDIFKSGSNYEQEILKIAKEHQDYRMFDHSASDLWQYSIFQNYWDAKKKNQNFLLTDEFFWVYAFSISDEGLIPGYGIPYYDLDKLIDKDGSFWKAFVSQENRAADLEYFAELPIYEEEQAELDEIARLEDEQAAEAARKAAESKKLAAAEKAAYAKGAANQKAAADKAAAQKAAQAKKSPAAQWQTTKVVNNQNGTLTINGQYINNNSDKSITRINKATITMYYKSTSGAQKTATYKFDTALEKYVAPKGVASAWFKVKLPSDYKSFVKATNQFNYSTVKN